MEYYNDGYGGIKRTSGAGKAFRMGSGHEVYSYTFPMYNHLDQVYIPKMKAILPEGNTIPETYFSKGAISVSRDPNGKEAVSFSDLEGRTLLAGLAQGEGTPINIAVEFPVDRLELTNGVIEFYLPQNTTVDFFTFSELINASGTTIFKFIGFDLYKLDSDNHSGAIYEQSEYTGNTPNVSSPVILTLEAGYYRYVQTSSFTPEDSPVSYSMQLYSPSASFYNDAGQLVMSTTPMGFQKLHELVPNSSANTNNVDLSAVDKTTYEYYRGGALKATHETDAGTSKFWYRRDGAIRFSQNSEQEGADKYSYTAYDSKLRPVESGQVFGVSHEDLIAQKNTLQADPITWNSTTNQLDQSAIAGIARTSVEQMTITVYDKAHEAVEGLAGYDQHFMNGAVSMTAYYTDKDHMVSRTWYSYDIYGNVEWVVMHTSAGLASIDYTYDFLGNVTEVLYRKYNDDQNRTENHHFAHKYTYDKAKRLIEVETKTIDMNAGYGWETQAEYVYYEHGPLKKVIMGEGLQEIDYTYTLQGWLKGINNIADADEDLFAMQLEYFSGDYISAAQAANNGAITPVTALAGTEGQSFNGNIRAAIWGTSSLGCNNFEKRAYQYTYDNFYQLQSATYGAFDNGTIDLNNSYKVSGLNYDLNGNIQALNRTNDEEAGMHQLTYAYDGASPNKLTSVKNFNTPYSAYTYNAIGQLTANTEAKTGYEYDVYGKMTRAYNTDNIAEDLMSVTYNDQGFRMKKVGVNGVETHYVRDLSGNVMAIYTKEPNKDLELLEKPVYGSGRVGSYKQIAGHDEMLYEIKDHVGSVRAIFTDEPPEPEYYDYHTDFELSKGMFVHSEAVPGEFYNIVESKLTTDKNHTPNGSKSYSLSQGDVLADKPVFYGKVGLSDSEINIVLYATSDVVDPGVNETMFNNGGGGQLISVTSAPNAVEGNPNDSYTVSTNFTNIIKAINEGQTPPTAPVVKVHVEYYNCASANPLMSLVYQSGEIYNDSWEPIIIQDNIPTFTEVGCGDIFVKVWIEGVYGKAWVDDLSIRTFGKANHLAFHDYYPFGLEHKEELCEHNEDYRYTYQGEYAEKDKETGFQAFQLRMYDPILGRWYSPDPYGQYPSPYVGMGNNPVNQFDPDGGYSKSGSPSGLKKAWLNFRLFVSGKDYITYNGAGGSNYKTKWHRHYSEPTGGQTKSVSRPIPYPIEKSPMPSMISPLGFASFSYSSHLRPFTLKPPSRIPTPYFARRPTFSRNFQFELYDDKLKKDYSGSLNSIAN